jgi:uncharacterized protein (DUF1330 family)
MVAYVIYHQTHVSDPETLKERYRGPALASVAKYGGRQLAGPPDNYEVLEGTWEGNINVLEFPDMETLKSWYNSDEFKALRDIRQSVAEGNLIVLAGKED